LVWAKPIDGQAITKLARTALNNCDKDFIFALLHLRFILCKQIN